MIMTKRLTKKQKDRRETIEAIAGGLVMIAIMLEVIYGGAIIRALM